MPANIIKKTVKTIQNLQLVYRPIDQIKLDPSHPRPPTETQISKAALCIHETNFIPPIIVDNDNNVIIGAEWLEAAKLADYTEVPIVYASALNTLQIKALRIAYSDLRMVRHMV